MLTVQFFQSIIQLDIAVLVAVAFSLSRDGEQHGRFLDRVALPVVFLSATLSIAFSLRALGQGLSLPLASLALGFAAAALSMLLGVLAGSRVAYGLPGKAAAIVSLGVVGILIAFSFIASPVLI